MRKIILSLLFFCSLPGALFAGFHLGLIDAAKNKVNQVDEKVTAKQNEIIASHATTIYWTGEINYVSSGVSPEAGTATTSFVFRVAYKNGDGYGPASGYPKVHIKKGGVEISGSPFTMTYVSGAYSSGAIYSYATTLVLGSDYACYFEAKSINNQDAVGSAVFSANGPVVSVAPTLAWTGEANYTADGLNPETGFATDPLTYRIKYADSAGNAPANGYPKVHIKKSGIEISGSPFTMTYVSGTNSSGAIYSYFGTLPRGTDYTYYFEAKDSYNISATNTASIDAPDISNSSPTLSWTGETNYTADGLNPETGNTATTFVYRVKYVDADNDAPAAGYPKVHILKTGVEILGSPFAMTAADSNAFTSGRKYTYSKTLSDGNDYTYYFEAQDVYGAVATGVPTSQIDSPDVIYVYSWGHSIVDSGDEVYDQYTAPSLALNSNGYPQVVYDGWNMRYATTAKVLPTDTDWVRTDLSGSGFFQSAALGTDNSMHIAYRDANGPCCGPNYTEKLSGQPFTTPITIGGGTSMDSDISIALDLGNRPYISYTYTWALDSYGNGIIHCAWRNGSSWVYLADVGAGQGSSISVGPNGYPQVVYSYVDANGAHLKYTKWNGLSWTSPLELDYGSSPSVKVDINNYPHIAYQSSTVVKYIEWTGLSWTSPQTIATGGYPSLALDSNINPNIAYTASANVYYAKRSSLSWSIQTAITGSLTPPVSYTRASLVLDSSGNPRIASGDGISGYLIYIWGQ